MNSKRMTISQRSINTRKSPITILEEDLQCLREKNAEDNVIIKMQQDEIVRMKERIAAMSTVASPPIKKLTKKPENKELLELETRLDEALTEKSLLQQRHDLVTAEKERLNSCILPTCETGKFENQIQQLLTELESNDAIFNKKTQEYKILLKDKERAIQNLQLKKKELIKSHRQEIQRIKSEKLPKPSKRPELKLDQLIEQALREFEQEQHIHPPQLSRQFLTNNNAPPFIKPGALGHINQQWYTRKYMPVSAVSWPPPQPIPNLKKSALFLP